MLVAENPIHTLITIYSRPKCLMMKLIFSITIFVLLALVSIAQPSATYYKNAANKNCDTLKTALKKIISTGVKLKSYSNLWNQYPISDVKPRTVGTGSATVIDDIYSSIPSGTDPYQYTPIANQCGTYTGENACYNREHSVPLNWFNGNTSTQGTATDYNFIFPTDGFVNGKRANFPYGEVSNATYTSQNGSKLGKSAIAGFTGNVFEPRDEFKGDVARAFLYFVTMYEDSIADWSSNADASQSFANNSFPSVKIPYLKLMLKWHNQDPVSQKEINRNNAAFTYQSNRNPFIDSPQFVNRIWNVACTGLAALPVEIQSFSGRISERSVLLQWQVGNEINLSRYLIERSIDGNMYQAVGEVKAVGKKGYLFEDAATSGSALFYRINIIDRDGSSNYSQVLRMEIPFSQTSLQIHPNPVKASIHLILSKELSSNSQIVIYDLVGKKVLQQTIQQHGKELWLPINSLPNGYYSLQLLSGGSLMSQRFMKAK